MVAQQMSTEQEGIWGDRKIQVCGRRKTKKLFLCLLNSVVSVVSALFYSPVKYICCHISQQEGIF
jgi:hypothetical protein